MHTTDIKFRVWHENGDFVGEYDNVRDASEAAEECECALIQTVQTAVDHDGTEYEWEL